jgi:hypothetical protein
MHFVRDFGLRVRGQMIAGFAAFKNHLSYFPIAAQ